VADSSLLRAIKSKEVDLVINLPDAKSSNVQGNFLLRRTSVDHAIPLLTNPKLAMLLADSLERHSRTPMVGLLPQALADHYKNENNSDAWTNPKEFH
jgi:MGS-like domain